MTDYSDKKNMEAFLVVGMAGAGKTTLCSTLVDKILKSNSRGKGKNLEEKISNINMKNNISNITTINLDPGVVNTKVPSTIDIRDYLDIKEIMYKHKLGYNGATMVAMNEFLLKHMEELDKKIDEVASNNNYYFIVDTPGQIEAFTWCAPGDILINYLLSRKIKVNLLFVVDVSEFNAYAFVSNLTYCAYINSTKKEKENFNVKIIFSKVKLNNNIEEVEKYLDYEYLRSNLIDSEISTVATYFEEFYSGIEIIRDTEIEKLLQ